MRAAGLSAHTTTPSPLPPAAARALRASCRVWGAAESTALRWWAEGCRSLDDVRSVDRGSAKSSPLTLIQQMGLRYYGARVDGFFFGGGGGAGLLRCSLTPAT
jgi:hypothetical protein